MEATILRGCSGSGKSTWTKTHIGSVHEEVVVCSADQFFMKDGEYKFNPKMLGEAHATCLRKFVSNAIIGAKELLVDNTNTTMSEVAPYAAVANAYGYRVRIVTLLCDPEIAHARNRHNVPLHVVEQQYKRLTASIGTFPKWWKEEVVDL